MLNIFALTFSVIVLYGDFMISGTHAAKCRYPFKKIGHGCYFINRETTTADRAFALCLRRGAYLANLETLEEAMLIKYELQQMHKGKSFFVGGRNINRYVPGGDWRWIRNGKMTKMTYKAFASGRPNGSHSTEKDCMIFYAPVGHSIYDDTCNHYLHGYICET
ncbi:Hypothetical predicted protein [Mytilus galloprovincialis]|uniref:C-type lectin domain-containing protein n=1 Tax=Mytilus galloprovincialis TaxID=29158 RepID=A0A8B6FBF0_MYTGA|nr:Hypothetical predicted protein [Mytilus galloprovincialis]